MKKLWAMAVLKWQGWCLKHMEAPQGFERGWSNYQYGCEKCYDEGMDRWRARRERRFKRQDERKIKALEILRK